MGEWAWLGWGMGEERDTVISTLTTLTRAQIQAAAQDLPQEQSQRVDISSPEGCAPVLQVQSLVQELWRHVPLGAGLESKAWRAKNHLPGNAHHNTGP